MLFTTRQVRRKAALACATPDLRRHFLPGARELCLAPAAGKFSALEDGRVEVVLPPRRWGRDPEGVEPPPMPAFTVLKRRWVVERTFAWLSQQAWEKGKAAYVKGGQHLSPPSVPVDIPFTHAHEAADDRDVPIQAYLRLPTGQPPAKGWPVLLLICGLDAYKTDHTPRTQAHVAHGFATLSFEIPGTGDCPAAPNDPASPDRLMSSVLDWVIVCAADYQFDPTRIVARGISTGGYYAMRIAHTHADRLFAILAQGDGCHYMFDPEWVHAQNQMEYPFALAEALAYKFGYRSDDPVETYIADAQKFSLLTSDVLDRPNCKLLVIDGMEDSIFSIEDNFIVGMRGNKKDLVAKGNRPHMGNPGAEDILYQWIDDAMAGKP